MIIIVDMLISVFFFSKIELINQNGSTTIVELRMDGLNKA